MNEVRSDFFQRVAFFMQNLCWTVFPLLIQNNLLEHDFSSDFFPLFVLISTDHNYSDSSIALKIYAKLKAIV